jgi:hypothetical protein
MLRLYLSPDGQTEPTMTGIMRGFRKFYSTAEDRRIVADAEPVVAKLKHIMTKRKLRIVDFFRAVQHDVAAAISPRKLVNAIELVTRIGAAIPSPSRSRSRSGSPSQSALSPQDAGQGTGSFAHLSSASPLSHSLSLAGDKSISLKRPLSSATKRAKAKLEPLPPDIVRRLQQREKEAQMALYTNGKKYCVAKSLSISRKLSMAHSLLQSPEVQDGSPKSAKSPSSAALLEATLREQSAEKAALQISSKKLPSHAALTLSDTFHAHAKKRTAELIKSFAQYDRKRVLYTKRLNAFF